MKFSLIQTRFSHLLLTGIFLAAVCLGCSSTDKGEEEKIKTAVTKYNIGLSEAYKNQLFDKLADAAVDDEVERINKVISAYLEDGEIMEMNLNSIYFGNVSMEGDKATIEASEKWSYRWTNYKTGRETQPLTEVSYKMRYYLLKKNGKWVIKKAEEIKQQF